MVAAKKRGAPLAVFQINAKNGWPCGRWSGNTPTEAVAAMLKAKGFTIRRKNGTLEIFGRGGRRVDPLSLLPAKEGVWLPVAANQYKCSKIEPYT